MQAHTDLILATANPHKVEELRAIFAAACTPGLRVLGLNDLPPEIASALREPEEHGTTFEENARIKAVSYAAQIMSLSRGSSRLPTPDSRLPTPFLCLADDSGLEIDALHGRPGVISSHYSTNGRETGLSRAQRDAANNARVLRELEGVPMERRTARFVCCMCLVYNRAPAVTPGSSAAPLAPATPTVLHTTRGTFEGRIGIPPRIPAGTNGFGYDPLFLVAPDFTRTGAELPSEEKNRLSHRGAAAMQMAEWLNGGIASTG